VEGGNARVQVFTADGRWKAFIQHFSFHWPRAVTVHGNLVFVGDRDAKTVFVFKIASRDPLRYEFVCTIGGPAQTDVPQLSSVTSLYLHKESNVLYICDYTENVHTVNDAGQVVSARKFSVAKSDGSKFITASVAGHDDC